MEHLVQHAVTTIRERFWEPLSLDELARSAMVSKYYFLRVFTRVTGVTPGRFLCAVRLQEAKRLLLSSSLTVADIAVRVGYSSTGSFTRRFTELVGLSPTQYRKLSLETPGEKREPVLTHAAPAASVPDALRRSGTVTGVLHTAATVLSPVSIGAFDSAVLQGTPASWTNVSAPGRFTLARVPAGTWYIHAVAQGRHPGSAPDANPTPLTATVGPVRVKGDTAHHRLDITLSSPDWTRPPILSALMDPDPQPMAA